jgi:DNA replication ATP-dependent helicase Dna2
MAKTFSTTKLFNENSTFQFFQDFKDLKANVYDEIFRVSNVVILNFSYLFANLNPEQTIELANNINQLVEMYPLNKYIVIYQNPVNKYHNFVKFKKELKEINKTIVRNTETVSYKNSESSWYDASERFTYEIITN